MHTEQIKQADKIMGYFFFFFLSFFGPCGPLPLGMLTSPLVKICLTWSYGSKSGRIIVKKN